MQWIQDISDFIFLSDEPRSADILFIPGNGHAEPSEKAASLYAQGIAPLVLPSGRYSIRRGKFSGQTSGNRQYPGEFETEWAFMHEILLSNGVPDESIVREDQATYTYQNALFSRAETDRLGLSVRRAIIVCVALHARRAKMYYETVFPEAEILVCPAAWGPDKDSWFETEDGIHRVLGEMERCGNQFHDILCNLSGISPENPTPVP